MNRNFNIFKGNKIVWETYKSMHSNEQNIENKNTYVGGILKIIFTNT